MRPQSESDNLREIVVLTDVEWPEPVSGAETDAITKDSRTTLCCRKAQRTCSRSGVRTLTCSTRFKSRLEWTFQRRHKNAARPLCAIVRLSFVQGQSAQIA